MIFEALDKGLPLEAGNFETANNELSRFRNYCNSLGKKTEELTQAELNAYYNQKSEQK